MFKKFSFLAIFILSVTPVSLAQQNAGAEGSGQEASPSQAQATMASLFSRGAKMPGILRIEGTIALPSFDNSRMEIEEGALNEASGRKQETE